jgi:hypothetical protein
MRAADFLGHNEIVSNNMRATMGKASNKEAESLQIHFAIRTRPEFGPAGVPQRWVNIPGRICGGGGPVSAWWRLNGGDPRVLGLGPDATRLPESGDFNVEAGVEHLVRGINTIEVIAEDLSGIRRSHLVDFLFEPPTAPLPPHLEIDADRCGSIYAFGQPVDGDWMLGRHGARCATMGYDRLLAFGDRSWTDYEFVAEVTIHGFDESHPGYPHAMGPGVGFLTRWTGHHEDGLQPRVEWRPCGVLGWYRFGRDRADSIRDYRLCMNAGDTSAPCLSGLVAEDTSGFRIGIGVPHFFRMRVKSQSGKTARYSLRVWACDSPEPREWNLHATGLACENGRGSILFVCHHADASVKRMRVHPV